MNCYDINKYLLRFLIHPLLNPPPQANKDKANPPQPLPPEAVQEPNQPSPSPTTKAKATKEREPVQETKKATYPVQENGSPKKFLANQKRWGSLERYSCRSGFLLFNVIFGGNGGKYFVYLLQKIQ